MSNLQKGEVSRVVNGEEYILRFTTNVWCNLEEASGLGMPAFLARLDSNPSIKDMRLLIASGCNSHSLTIEEIGNLIDDGGGIVFANKWVLEAITASSLAVNSEESAPLAKPQAQKRRTGAST